MKLKNFLQLVCVAAWLPVAAVAGDIAKGKELSATCAACHGADGNSTIPTNPKLAGQYESYLIQALSDYKSGARTNAIMSGFATGLSACLLYTSPSPRDRQKSRMPSSA